MRRQSTRLAFVALSAILVALGCAGREDDAGIETVRSAYWYFGGWTNIPGGTLLDSAALAKGANTTLTVYGLGGDNQIYTTWQDANGRWTGVWGYLTGGTFASRPAVVAIDAPSGAFANHFAIVAQRSDGAYYVRIMNQNGSSVPVDWTPVKTNGTTLLWSSAPAIASVPESSTSLATLVVAGRNNEGRVQAWETIVHTSGDYFYSNSYYDIPSNPFAFPPFSDTAPTLAYLAPNGPGQSTLAMAWGVAGPSGTTYKLFWMHPHPLRNWMGPPQNIPNGLFNSGPALAATNQGQAGRELTLYGIGLDNRIWVTNDLTYGSFAQINPQIVSGNPMALGYAGITNVSALINGNVPYMNRDRFYSYSTRVFDNGDSMGYTGGGDWAVNEFKGACAADEWVLGVSVNGASRAHSIRCASAAGPTMYTSNRHTLDISAGNYGFGNHNLPDWDAGFYKGECAAAEAVVGLSQDGSGALNHVRCAPVDAFGTNCRALQVQDWDNRESPGDSAEWAYNYRKYQCRRGSAVAGVSRNISTGAVHAILCCDFASL